MLLRELLQRGFDPLRGEAGKRGDPCIHWGSTSISC
jgi:hypothetical protein